MRVSVVVPTYRRPELLARCLAALARQQVASEYEVVVADDSGGDEAARRVVKEAESAGVRFRYLPVTGNHGPAAARNAGWQAASGEIIAFTDDDCLPDSGWLAAGIAPFADEHVVAVTGQTSVPLPPRPTDYERDAAGLERAEFVTANCFVRRSVLESLGGFDESFPAAWREDSDLHFRLLDTGGQLVKASEAIVVHPVRPAPWGISLRQQKKISYDALLYRKHPQRYRERISPRGPWHYYMIALSLAAAVAFASLGMVWAAVVAAIIWMLFTGRFVLHRLAGTARTAGHVAEMIVTSLAIPLLALFWRLYGAVRYRVAFW
jgi:GT2 family glycosyltransferase